MTCYHSTDGKVHVCAPAVFDRGIHKAVCPDCKMPTRMIGFYYLWYGWTSTCIRCGRQWSDGEWMELDFYRYARRDNIKIAKDLWRRCTKSNWKKGDIEKELAL